jgi:hypothetical protein
MTNNNNGGIGLTGILTILFVVCKIAGYIDWSWWWVVSPLWISVCILAVLIFVGGIILGINNR